MKTTKIFITSVLFYSSISFGAVPLLSKIIGVYSLENAVSGFCPSEIRIEKEDFYGQEKGVGLGIYCNVSEECHKTVVENGINVEYFDNIIYQFSRLNLPAETKMTTNVMFGQPDGWTYSAQSFKNGILNARDKTTNLFGMTIFDHKFEGKFDKGVFSYTSDNVNSINAPHKTFRSCVYKFIKKL